MIREEVTFQSAKERCAGWWYSPGGRGRKPFVVMGHGIGATREMGLDAIASRFCEAGLCVLAFDYRHYGASTGTPRDLLSVARQKADYYPRLLPAGYERAHAWRNRVTARAALGISRYEPAQLLSEPGPPVLVIVGDADTMTPAAWTVPAALHSKRARLLRYPGGHFDHFLGPGVERAIADQLTFLEQHLGFSRRDVLRCVHNA